MVTLRNCSDLAQAELIKSFLAGSGVASFLPDENSVLWSNALGGIRVQVADEDAGRAEEILREFKPAT
jgi:hypothetical protein